MPTNQQVRHWVYAGYCSYCAASGIENLLHSFNYQSLDGLGGTVLTIKSKRHWAEFKIKKRGADYFNKYNIDFIHLNLSQANIQTVLSLLKCMGLGA